MSTRGFIRCSSGATAAEFALVLPLLLLFIFGLIDVGRVMWTLNRAEKATQMGVRFAVATRVLPQGLNSYSFVTQGGLPQGVLIPESSFGGATCTSTGCTCKAGATCPPLGTFDSVAFTEIVERMQAALPDVEAANVQVLFRKWRGSRDIEHGVGVREQVFPPALRQPEPLLVEKTAPEAPSVAQPEALRDTGEIGHRVL